MQIDSIMLKSDFIKEFCKKDKIVVYLLSRVQFFCDSWTVGCQSPLSMGFFRQEYWSGLPFPIPEDLLDSGIESASPALAGRFFIIEPPGKPKKDKICGLNILS